MSLPTFVTPELFAAGQTITLGEREAHHIRVLRLNIGTQVGLRDGHGLRGSGTLVRLAKRHAAVTVEHAVASEPPPAVHLMLPVADRERMMWLAEKATELGATSWRPVIWKRSRSVGPRGEGPTFTQKVAARMTAALEQCRGVWLPTLFPEATPERAVAATPEGPRLLLDERGDPIATLVAEALDGARQHGAGRLRPITIAVGPEGGLDESEVELLASAHFRSVSLGRSVLRFETAALAALAVVHSALATLPPSIKGAREVGDD